MAPNRIPKPRARSSSESLAMVACPEPRKAPESANLPTLQGDAATFLSIAGWPALDWPCHSKFAPSASTMRGVGHTNPCIRELLRRSLLFLSASPAVLGADRKPKLKIFDQYSPLLSVAQPCGALKRKQAKGVDHASLRAWGFEPRRAQSEALRMSLGRIIGTIPCMDRACFWLTGARPQHKHLPIRALA